MEIKSKRDWNLYQKINEIQNGAMEVVKGGKNNFAKYNYKTFTNIKEAVMGKMHDLGVVFLPAEPEVSSYSTGAQDGTSLDLKINKDGKATQVSYIQCYELINADKPEERQRFLFPMIGTNNDGADKANGSATTYGLKYLMNLWALIPDESLDPDTRDKVEEEKPKKEQQKSKYTPDMLKILKEIGSHTPMGDVLKGRITVMLGIDKPTPDDIINGIQNDEHRMNELLEIMKED